MIDSLHKDTLFLHREPASAIDFWLDRLIDVKDDEYMKAHCRRRLISSVGTYANISNLESLAMSNRLFESDLALYISDRLRQADMHRVSIDLLISSLDFSDNKFKVLERIGYIVNQLARARLLCNDATVIQNWNERFEQWASCLLGKLKRDNSCRLSLGVSAHLLALHDSYGSRYLLNQMVGLNHRRLDRRIMAPKLIMLVGPGKTGTTSIHKFITERYELISYQGKEIDYWDIYWKHGLPCEWLLNHFYHDGTPANSQGSIVVDNSPSSFGSVSDLAPSISRMQSLISTFILMTFRDPVRRAVSMLVHELSTSCQNPDIQAAIIEDLELANNEETLHQSILYQSRYEIFGPAWIETVGSSKCLSISLEDFSADGLDLIFGSWGVGPVTEASIGHLNKMQLHKPSIRSIIEDPDLLHKLTRYFSPTYEWLASEKTRVIEVLR